MLPKNAKIFVWSEQVDGRSGKDTLAGLVSREMRTSVFNGDVYVFVSLTQRRVKVLFHDGSGVVMVSKILDAGTVFPLLQGENGQVTLNADQFDALFHGDNPLYRREERAKRPGLAWSKSDIKEPKKGEA